MASFHSKARISLDLLLSFLFLCSFLSFSANGKEQKEFDYFALALQWPGTYCQRTKYCCPSNGCCRGSLAPTEFTIHGLWPDYNDGSWPACCSNSRFDSKKIKSLTGMLERYWPSLSCSSSSVCHGGKGIFWAHEWEKHGTCSYPVIKDEYDYFSAVLDLYSKYNITKVLFDAGFVPTNNIGYPLKDIISTIEETFGVSPLVVCKDGAVEELHICFYKDFTPRDCLTGSNAQEGMLNSRRSSCPSSVSLPEYVPLMLKGENATSTWLSDGEAL